MIQSRAQVDGPIPAKTLYNVNGFMSPPGP
jgi:hypothetical protein